MGFYGNIVVETVFYYKTFGLSPFFSIIKNSTIGNLELIKLLLEGGFLELEFFSIEDMTILKVLATYCQLIFLDQHIFFTSSSAVNMIILLNSCLPTKQRKVSIGFSFPMPWSLPYHIFLYNSIHSIHRKLLGVSG